MSPPDEKESKEPTTASSYNRLLNDDPNKTSQHEQQRQPSFWQEDEWTEEDSLEAARILHEAQDCCTIPLDSKQRQDPPVKDWNHFYKRHTTNFFQDRHYLRNEQDFSSPQTLVEIGCGVGNTIWPLLTDGWTVWGLDFSPVAIDLLRRDERFDQAGDRVHAQVWDVTCNSQEEVPWLGVGDVSTLLFCLSAIHPDSMSWAAVNAVATLKPGGMLVVRDYGRYDQAQLKLGTSRGKRLGDNFYRKQDGTRCYYFSLGDLERLFTEAGLQVVELKYIRRVYHNRSTGERRRRVWVQGRFQKPT